MKSCTLASSSKRDFLLWWFFYWDDGLNVLHETCSWQKRWGDFGAAQFSKSSPQPLLLALWINLREMYCCQTKRQKSMSTTENIFWFQIKCKGWEHCLTLLKHAVKNVDLDTFIFINLTYFNLSDTSRKNLLSWETFLFSCKENAC